MLLSWSRGYPPRLFVWVLTGLAATLVGCVATVKEQHYFAAFNEPAPGVREPAQFFRITVEGTATFSNARYLTGYFDERAVTLFFNEMKGTKDSKVFTGDQLDPGTNNKLTPLTPPSGEGAFVLIMSTNADSIASTIGSFAESQVLADWGSRTFRAESNGFSAASQQAGGQAADWSSRSAYRSIGNR